MASPFIHIVVCLTTSLKPLPQRAIHIARSRVSSFKWEYPLLSLRSSSSCVRLLPRLLVNSIPLLSFLQYLVVEGSFYAKSDQSTERKLLKSLTRSTSHFLSIHHSPLRDLKLSQLSCWSFVSSWMLRVVEWVVSEVSGNRGDFVFRSRTV